ncbi:MAG: hypothetical protein RBR88_01535 [Candidatus Saccharicenans sp.]|nr:hypothetical protein [Candidatus Saccharicenans sp.]
MTIKKCLKSAGPLLRVSKESKKIIGACPRAHQEFMRDNVKRRRSFCGNNA